MTAIARRIRLTGRAQRYVQLLQEFGHIDERRVEDLLVSLADAAPPGATETLVDLPALRRAAAIVLFGEGDPHQLRDLEQGPLAEDWPFLFS